ncbi:MAG: hypothetical protein ACPGTU_03205 [Myxococcota bacterium]
MNAVCHRCGGTKAGIFQACESCGFVPLDQERALAWLFSKAHLNDEELMLAAQRIRNGEVPEPGKHLLHFAQARTGEQQRDHAGDKAFTTRTLIAIGAMDLLLTPLAGFAIWWGHRIDRPTAAAQALRITLPIAAALGALWFCLVAFRLFSYSSS